jgi:hypothetical protein
MGGNQSEGLRGVRGDRGGGVGLSSWLCTCRILEYEERWSGPAAYAELTHLVSFCYDPGGREEICRSRGLLCRNFRA